MFSRLPTAFSGTGRVFKAFSGLTASGKYAHFVMVYSQAISGQRNRRLTLRTMLYHAGS